MPPHCLEICGGHRLSVPCVGHDEPAEPSLEVLHIRGQTKHSHYLRSNRDIEPRLPWSPIGLATQATNDIPQLPLVHVHHTTPSNPVDIDIQIISLVNVVVQHGCEKVMGSAYCVDVSCKCRLISSIGSTCE